MEPLTISAIHLIEWQSTVHDWGPPDPGILHTEPHLVQIQGSLNSPQHSDMDTIATTLVPTGILRLISYVILHPCK